MVGVGVNSPHNKLGSTNPQLSFLLLVEGKQEEEKVEKGVVEE